jgi:hypothetical protein
MADNKKLEVDMMNNFCPPMGGCIPQETVIKDVLLARAYVPFQKLCTLFPPIEALQRGTVFPELFSPYEKKDKKQRPHGYK